MDMKPIWAYLRAVQEAKNLNDAEVAAALKPLLGRDVSASTIWRIAGGDTKKSRADMLLGLLAVLGVSPADILHVFRAQVSTEEAAKMGKRAAGGEINEEMIRDAWRRVPDEKRAAARARLIAEIEK